MTGDFRWDAPFALDLAFGYGTQATTAPQRYNPRLVLNQEGTTVLRSILEELTRCDRFTFSVAFVTPGAIALLIQELRDFQGTGCIITSDYLGFNSPSAFADLHKLTRFGIDVRLHRDRAFHPKGYIFETESVVTALVGSSNLTKQALVTNHEWNLKVSAASGSDLATQVSTLVEREIAQSQPLTAEWIAAYTERYVPPSKRTQRTSRSRSDPPFNGDLGACPADSDENPTTSPIVANRMQVEALEALSSVRKRGETKAMVISATGTGKTILAALDVRSVNPSRLLFVAHREQILDRTIEAFHSVLGGPHSHYGKLTGGSKATHAPHVFATVQTLSRPDVLFQIDRNAFDYVIIDEAHRSGADTYRRVIDHFTPKFMLGMTATPERGDGQNIFELFDFNVAYEIRLGAALEADMLSPFHYYGVADLDDEHGEASGLSVVVDDTRIDHLIEAIETYGQAGVTPRGLVFCSRKEMAGRLAAGLDGREINGAPIRALSLTGDDSVEAREQAVRDFEAGHLHYIVTVDVFNEGVDIPTVNQVIMLRPTQSAIIFVQQLGRGLRKAPGKDHLVVIDFIGNHANNFLIPVALFGDDSLNKESLRRNLIQAAEAGILPGLSSVRFDRVAQERILRAISQATLDSLSMIKSAVLAMAERVGGTPRLWDFYRFDSADPVLLATKGIHFPALAAKILGTPSDLTSSEDSMLQLLSWEVMTAKRLHEFHLVRLLLDHGPQTPESIQVSFTTAGISATQDDVRGAIETLTLTNFADVDRRRYGAGIATGTGTGIELRAEFSAAYRSKPDFRAAVDDLLKTGMHLVIDRYSVGSPFVVGAQYTRKEVTRLLNFPRSWTSTMYGYKADPVSRVCPAFITLHKSTDVAASTAYEDALIDAETLVWFSKSRRSLASPLEGAIARGEYRLPMFIKKDDAEGSDFYFLGDAVVTDAHDASMLSDNGARVPVVRMQLRLTRPIDSALYNYLHPTLTDE